MAATTRTLRSNIDVDITGTGDDITQGRVEFLAREFAKAIEGVLVEHGYGYKEVSLHLEHIYGPYQVDDVVRRPKKLLKRASGE